MDASRSRVYDRAGVGLDVRSMDGIAAPSRVLMVDPACFRVEYAINPFMEGQLGTVDPRRARTQWGEVKEVFERLGYPVTVLPAVEGLPDLVFTANQTFPVPPSLDAPDVFLSKMATPQRVPEVVYFERWYRHRGARIAMLDDASVRFEGMGDAMWWPGRRLVVGGHGFRSDPRAYDELAARLDTPFVRLRLVDPRFYHLDTCLQFLDEQTALFVPEAFEPAGVALLEEIVPRLVDVPLREAVEGMACNGYCPDGRHFVVQRGNTETLARVRKVGFEIIEVDTSEFVKSGGSVYCMKNHLFAS